MSRSYPSMTYFVFSFFFVHHPVKRTYLYTSYLLLSPSSFPFPVLTFFRSIPFLLHPIFPLSFSFLLIFWFFTSFSFFLPLLSFSFFLPLLSFSFFLPCCMVWIRCAFNTCYCCNRTSRRKDRTSHELIEIQQQKGRE